MKVFCYFWHLHVFAFADGGEVLCFRAYGVSVVGAEACRL